MSRMYNCPVCNGEKQISQEHFREFSHPSHVKMIAFAASVAIVILAGAVLALALEARKPTEIEQCANSCGQSRFKTFTTETREWTEHMEIGKPDIHHPPVPSKCECVVQQ